jgi:hypothetical protein
MYGRTGGVTFVGNESDGAGISAGMDNKAKTSGLLLLARTLHWATSASNKCVCSQCSSRRGRPEGSNGLEDMTGITGRHS